MSRNGPLGFYEFFAGGGMARLGLGDGWSCLYANDFDPVKAATYRANFTDADEHFHEGDVWQVKPADLPGQADLAWASSPCQDFSLAGNRAGLAGGRSSAFFGFWKLMEALNADGRAPRTIVVENVVGLLSSHSGRDFEALCGALSHQGYRFGAVEIDAVDFVPQSRPRVFIVATKVEIPHNLQGSCTNQTTRVCLAFAHLPAHLRLQWVWWHLPKPPTRNSTLASILQPDVECDWHSETQTKALLDLTSRLHSERLKTASTHGDELVVGTAFRRMRSEHGVKHQRLEIRYDGVAGCLRTPGGGSSRQAVVVASRDGVRTRLLTAREAARLMGIDDSYKLPVRATAAMHVMGDGVVTHVVRWLATHLLTPLAQADSAEQSLGKIASRSRARPSGT